MYPPIPLVHTGPIGIDPSALSPRSREKCHRHTLGAMEKLDLHWPAMHGPAMHGWRPARTAFSCWWLKDLPKPSQALKPQLPCRHPGSFLEHNRMLSVSVEETNWQTAGTITIKQPVAFQRQAFALSLPTGLVKIQTKIQNLAPFIPHFFIFLSLKPPPFPSHGWDPWDPWPCQGWPTPGGSVLFCRSRQSCGFTGPKLLTRQFEETSHTSVDRRQPGNHGSSFPTKNTKWKDTTKVTFSNNAIIMWTSKVWQMSAAWKKLPTRVIQLVLQWLDPLQKKSPLSMVKSPQFFPSGTSPPRFHLLNLIPVFDE